MTAGANRDRERCRTIAIANQKGGVGKTTTAINLGAGLANAGRRILLVDVDPQANATSGLGLSAETSGQPGLTMYDVLMNPEVPLQDIVRPAWRSLDLAPSDLGLAAAEHELGGVEGRERRLRDKLLPLGPEYDFVIIDCPPSLGHLTFNALYAADELLVPISPSYFAASGVPKLLELVELLQEEFGRRLALYALVTISDGRTVASRDIQTDAGRFFGPRLLSTVIHVNVALENAARAGIPILEYDPRARGAEDYTALAEEVVKLAEE